MRFSRILTTLALLCIIAAAPARSAEATRTLKGELPADSGAQLAVENLVGSFRVLAGSGDQLVATVTVHAETEELAQKVRFERVEGRNGRPTLRVRYPLDEVRTIRYSPSRSTGFLGKLMGGNSGSSTKYDGERVKVSRSRGVVLYADVEVELPSNSLDVVFRNEVGSIHAEGVQGTLSFDSSSGEVVLENLEGTISADTGSGDVNAERIDGSFDCDTGSGDCMLTDFRGEDISCDVGSGDVLIRAADARSINVDAGSGDIKVMVSEIEEFDADTGSGDILLETEGLRLNSVRTDTGSGDVTLRLGPNAGFDARADQGSGDFKVRFSDAEGIIRRNEIVRYRRGDGRIQIQVSTGSGDLVIEPIS